MHPHTMLSEMVADRQRELIFDAAAFRRAAGGQPRPFRPFASVRQLVGHRLVRLGQALAGAPVPAGGLPLPVGRQG